jgi:hypothetical protein
MPQQHGILTILTLAQYQLPPLVSSRASTSSCSLNSDHLILIGSVQGPISGRKCCMVVREGDWPPASLLEPLAVGLLALQHKHIDFAGLRLRRKKGV